MTFTAGSLRRYFEIAVHSCIYSTTKNMWLIKIIFLFALLLQFTHATEPKANHDCTKYKAGDKFTLQCLNATGEWSSGPICDQSGEELYFLFGMDSFMNCAMEIKDWNMYWHLTELIKQEANWNCRVQMAPNHNSYIPVHIPLWGVVEEDHVHIANHINFVFHAGEEAILGAAAYPIASGFQMLQRGQVLTIHGAVKWFHAHSFHDYSQKVMFATGGLSGVIPLVFYCLVTIFVSIFLFTFVYKNYLRPKLIRSNLKRD